MKRFLGISLFVCLESTILFARTPQEAAHIASLFISKSHVETIYLAIIGIPKWILPIFQVALPLLIWMISEVKNRMKKT